LWQLKNNIEKISVLKITVMRIVSGLSERYGLAEPTLVWAVSSPF